ncbi:MAG: rRNA maturation RNase YbeY [Candidatus Dormiibacterota bacterium]
MREPQRRPGDPTLDVRIVKAVPASLRPAWLRQVLRAAVEEPAVAAAIARLTGVRPAAVTIRLTGSREIRRLHVRFLDDPAETDVLSFPSASVADDGYLGDLALCWPVVMRQAAAYAQPAETEAALLAVHGLLHLLGWDHATPSEEREMTARALAALSRSGVRPALDRLPERERR